MHGLNKRIYFYSPRGKFGYLANISRHQFLIAGVRWKTVEHYYQAQKFIGCPIIFNLIRWAKTPMEAKRIAQLRKKARSTNWSSKKNGIMRKAIRAKFTQNTKLASKLLATGDAELVERAQDDPYWGSGPDGNGLNKMGRMLMSLRTRLRNEAAQKKGSKRNVHSI
jgi:N-glycosidase YbiA